MLLIGIDLGTTGVKAVVFDREGRILALEYQAYRQEAAAGKRELSPEEVWGSCAYVLKSAAEKCPADGEAYVCVSSFGEGFVCLDGQGNILSPVMLLTDDRGTGEFQAAAERIGDRRTAEICGLKPHVSYSLSKILYLKTHSPLVFENTRHLLLMGDFIYYKLGGVFCTDYSMASRTMLFDVHRKEWSKPLLKELGLPEEIFSRPVQGGTLVGEAAPGIREKLHLPGKTYLVMGGHDQPCSAVVSQGREGGTICSMGTSECITPILKEEFSPEQILANGHPNEPFLRADTFNTVAYNVTSGLLTDWFTKVFAKREKAEGEDVFALLEGELPDSPTRIMVLPYLHGSGTPYLDADARLSLMGMDEHTRRGDIYQAVLEGLCMDQRLNIHKLGWQHIQGKSIFVTGGGSRCRPWLQLKADILNYPIQPLECSQAGALGCAVLCAVAAGVYADMEEAADHMVRTREAILPRPDRSAFYEEKYQIYQHLYESCQEVNAYVSRSK